MSEERSFGAKRFETESAARDEAGRFVAFFVGEERYLVEISSVKEIVRVQKMTRMPNSPAGIEGVIDLRGVFVPILDLRRRLDAPADAPGPRARIIVTVARGHVAGLLVDELLPVMRVPLEKIKPPPPMTREMGYDFVTGMCTHEGEVYMLFNPDGLLDPALFAHHPDRAEEGTSFSESPDSRQESADSGNARG
jgi:purine-binding chemotaxis protein CheW